MRQLINQIKTQCIFKVTKVYLILTSMTTTTINIRTDSLPKVGAHPLRPGPHEDRSLQESGSVSCFSTLHCAENYRRNSSLSLQLAAKNYFSSFPCSGQPLLDVDVSGGVEVPHSGVLPFSHPQRAGLNPIHKIRKKLEHFRGTVVSLV